MSTFFLNHMISYLPVEGYPHWSGKVELFELEPTGKPPKKYPIILYGTRGTGNLKAEDLIPKHKNRDHFEKKKCKNFNKGLWEIKNNSKLGPEAVISVCPGSQVACRQMRGATKNMNQSLTHLALPLMTVTA